MINLNILNLTKIKRHIRKLSYFCNIFRFNVYNKYIYIEGLHLQFYSIVDITDDVVLNIYDDYVSDTYNIVKVLHLLKTCTRLDKLNIIIYNNYTEFNIERNQKITNIKFTDNTVEYYHTLDDEFQSDHTLCEFTFTSNDLLLCFCKNFYNDIIVLTIKDNILNISGKSNDYCGEFNCQCDDIAINSASQYKVECLLFYKIINQFTNCHISFSNCYISFKSEGITTKIKLSEII